MGPSRITLPGRPLSTKLTPTPLLRSTSSIFFVRSLAHALFHVASVTPFLCPLPWLFIHLYYYLITVVPIYLSHTWMSLNPEGKNQVGRAKTRKSLQDKGES